MNCIQYEECNRAAYAKGMCLMHYKRVWRGGRVDRTKRAPSGLTLERHLEWHGWNTTDSGCWEWRGGRFRGGYGSVSHGNRTLIASRAAWVVWRGDIPNGLHVLHTCDNRLCINPEHLWLGTNEDNVRDKMEKGRWRVGNG